jgi:NTE family protein
VRKADLPKHTRKTEYYKSANQSAPGTSSHYVYNKETLGFRLDSGQEIAVFRDGAEPQHNEIKDFVGYAKALVGSIMSAQANQHLHSDDWHRTVYIDTVGVGTTDFDIEPERKQALIGEGLKGTGHYFGWYDAAAPEDMPSNHVDSRD